MQKILITYGTPDFKETLQRLQKEAKRLKLFDKIILYEPNDLPDYIKSNSLMAFKKGGGYWLWKPYIIWKTLQDYKDAVVIYVDGGCTLQSTNEWTSLFEKIKNVDTILFRYRSEYDYNWTKIEGVDNTRIQHWTKKNTIEYFNLLFKGEDWTKLNKIWGGNIFCKNKDNRLIREWLNISLFQPQLIMDPFGNEIDNQYDSFIEHRHDQSILTPLGHYYSRYNEVLILPELSESKKSDAAVVASRITNLSHRTYRKRIIRMLRNVLGDRFVELLGSFVH